MGNLVFKTLIPGVDAKTRSAIARHLKKFGEGAIRLAAERGIKIRVLGAKEDYAAASPALAALLVGGDSQSASYAGLFVIAERTLYLRSTSKMTVAHEFAHALDCALGDGVYLSTLDAEIRRAFNSARDFVSPYAATSRDEYFAECVRAWVGRCNDPAYMWPSATRKRLNRIDPAMYAIVERLFERVLSAPRALA